MSNFYHRIQIEKYVVMPNHVHLLLNVLDESGLTGTPAPTNAAVPSFVSTLKRRVNRLLGENIWQRSYHDHVIRDEADYLRIWEYIDTNPIKWQDDCYYTPEKDNV